jgi:PKD repeat protein
VDTPLTAAFDAVNPGGVAPVTVQFLDRSVGGATSWSWTSPTARPRTCAARRTPSRRRDLPGAAHRDRRRGSNTGAVPVEIGEPVPEARFSVSSPGGVSPVRVEFTDRSIGNVTSFLWDFGDGTGSVEQSPVHHYITPGVFTVRFRVWSAGGVDGTIRRNLITITSPGPLPHAGTSQGAPAPLRWIQRLLPKF